MWLLRSSELVQLLLQISHMVKRIFCVSSFPASSSDDEGGILASVSRFLEVKNLDFTCLRFSGSNYQCCGWCQSGGRGQWFSLISLASRFLGFFLDLETVTPQISRHADWLIWDFFTVVPGVDSTCLGIGGNAEWLLGVWVTTPAFVWYDCLMWPRYWTRVVTESGITDWQLTP